MMGARLLLPVLLLLGVAVQAKTYFKETFDSDKWDERWVVSDWKKSDGTRGELKVTTGLFYGDGKINRGLKTMEDARFYGISAEMEEKFTTNENGKPFVLQFSAKHEQNLDCGGGYIKVLPEGLDQSTFSGDSKYAIMFGPDICGSSTKKIHVIFNYKGKHIEYKKVIPPPVDQLTHVFTLIVNYDQTYEVRVDGEKKEKGKLEDDFDFLPPKKIKDPSASKPDDWVDDEKIPDPESKKPDNYDDIPAKIPDPDAKQPEDWDVDSDGEWEAPTIDNPEYKGPWKPKMIKNPDYKGPWVHPMIDNPDFKQDDTMHIQKDLKYVGFELWQVRAGTVFDNIYVGNSVEEAESLMEDTWSAVREKEKKALEEHKEKKKIEDQVNEKAAEEAVKEKVADEDEDEEEKDEL